MDLQSSTMRKTLSRRALFAGALGSAQYAHLYAQKKVRVGLAGFDGHPEEILRVLPQSPGIELVAVAADGSDSAALDAGMKNSFAARAHHYDALDDMLAHETLDVVALCNNGGRRAASIRACAARKLNVIAEKPLALNRADLDAVYSDVKKSGIRLGMLLPMRFDPPYLAMRRIVRSGEIGEVLQMDAQKSYQLGPRPEWQKHAATYGSTILWIAIHGIDLMLRVGGRRFVEVASLQSHVAFPEIGDMQNVTASIFRMDNGGTASLSMDYLRPETAGGHGDDRLRVAGTLGVVEYQESTGVTLLKKGAPPRVIRDLDPQGSVFLDFLSPAPTLTWPQIVAANEATLAADSAAHTHGFVAIPT
ncbi:MAG: oxidoreductase domain protein [Candidatus Solibacter sp.]|nr:oxidoreductase domain protein [Candidatus Solibacter sp.]